MDSSRELVLVGRVGQASDCERRDGTQVTQFSLTVSLRDVNAGVSAGWYRCEVVDGNRPAWHDLAANALVRVVGHVQTSRQSVGGAAFLESVFVVSRFTLLNTHQRELAAA